MSPITFALRHPITMMMVVVALVGSGKRVLDVGCGPGALTAVLAAELGAESVSAIDPSPSFVASVRDRPTPRCRRASGRGRGAALAR